MILRPKIHTAGQFPPTPHLCAAGASPIFPADGAVALLIAPAGLTWETKTGKEWGRWGSGQASPRTPARGEASCTGSPQAQAPSPTEPAPSGPEEQMREKEGDGGRTGPPREPIQRCSRGRGRKHPLPSHRFQLPPQAGGCQKSQPWGWKILLFPIRFC